MFYQFVHYRFNMLTVQQACDVFQLRSEVFVVEQDCVYQDIDGQDANALHLLAYDDSETLVAYARIFEKGAKDPDYAWIGRVVVRQSYRKKRLGHELMKQAIGIIEKTHVHAPIKISAQSHLVRFYAALGFVATGKNYIEDGIPHSEMVRV